MTGADTNAEAFCSHKPRTGGHPGSWRRREGAGTLASGSKNGRE